jgi:hypothetical protein
MMLLLLFGRWRQDVEDVEVVEVVGVGENGENKNKNFWSADTLGWHSSRNEAVIHKKKTFFSLKII